MKIWTSKGDTGTTVEPIEQLRRALEDAEAVIVGAGAGLSTSAGFTYNGARFYRYFKDFNEKYGITDMYSGGFYPFRSYEEQWAWWSRHIYVNRYIDDPKPVYRHLLQLLEGRDYFIITTNVDHRFQRAGFDKERLFYTQGDYGLWQNADGSVKKTYDNEADVKKMLLAQGFWFEHVMAKNGIQVEDDSEMVVRMGRDIWKSPDLDYTCDWGELLPPTGVAGKADLSLVSTRIPSELLPFCPDDGTPMAMNLRADNTFVEDEGWHLAANRYKDYIAAHKNRRVLFLDLGSGGNTPVIFKIPFMRWTLEWPDATYATINLGEAYAPREIAEKSICINDDIGSVIEQLL